MHGNAGERNHTHVSRRATREVCEKLQAITATAVNKLTEIKESI